MNLNEKLTELRKAKGLTQQEIAEALHVSRQAVSRWEVGTAAPSLDNMAYLSRLYGVPLDDFVNEEAEPLADAPAEVPAAAPARTGRTPVASICLFLAVLILGVGILIGINLRKEAGKKEVYLYAVPRVDIDENSRVTVGGPEITVGWLEKTPADREDEAQWLEENSGSGSEKAQRLP